MGYMGSSRFLSLHLLSSAAALPMAARASRLQGKGGSAIQAQLPTAAASHNAAALGKLPTHTAWPRR